MKKVNRLTYITAVMLALLLCLITFAVNGGVGGKAYAASTVYTNVLDDLSKDKSFKMSDYPPVKDDYGLDIIQLAESNSGVLYLYVYQPCGEIKTLIATTARISTATEDNKRYLDYKLTLLNANGVFHKYRVEGLTVSTDNVRYYDIPAIHRKWDSTIDKATGSDNTINEKAFPVGKLYTVETVNGAIKYSCIDTDVVEILNPYVDFLSYGNSSAWDAIFNVTQWTDIHYIAFSTDKQIDTLKEADVTYATQPYHYTGKNNAGYTYGEKSEPQYLTLTGEEEIGVTGFKKYTWNSIYRSEDFIKTTELSGTAKTQVKNSEFVLVFLKTAFKEQEKWSMMQGHYKEADGTRVSDVSILRLKFETDGVCYNLGAVTDKISGDDVPGNKQDEVTSSFDFWQYVWSCIKKLFTWTGSVLEKAVGVIAILIAVAVIAFVIRFLKWVYRSIFK